MDCQQMLSVWAHFQYSSLFEARSSRQSNRNGAENFTGMAEIVVVL